MVNDSENTGHGREGALSALREVVEATDRKRFGLALDSFESEDYEEIVRLAWRYQFDEDRSKFKRELRDLQKHVSDRILAKMELMNE
ncbi:hypothetical protein [Kocuria sp. U4B]